MHMHDIEIVVIWFFLVNAGMILTLLIPRMVSKSCSREINHDNCDRISVRHGVPELASSLAFLDKAA
jgi:hypothetical protein